MANIEIQNNDLGSVILKDAYFSDELLTFAAVGTVLEGTILARDTATLKLVPYVKGGTTDGNGIPNAVLTYDIAADAAGDVSLRAMITGCVRAERLIIAADGDGSNVDAVVLDQLRGQSIVSIGVDELNTIDNQ